MTWIKPMTAMPAGAGGTADNGNRVVLPVIAAGVASIALVTVLLLAGDMPRDVRIVLAVLGIAAIGWTVAPISDAAIGVCAVVALAIAGILEPHQVVQSATRELVWLLIASLALAGVLGATGLVECAVWGLCRWPRTLRQLVFALAGPIALTAFLIPSTTARAALLVPVFLALARQIESKPAVRGLALLFPTVILLSASGSLIGAGAHVIAVEYIVQSTGERLNYMSWLVLMLPIALLSSAVAALIIMLRFIPKQEFAPLVVHPQTPWTRAQLVLASIVVVMVLLFATYPLHGWSPAAVAAIAAACAWLARPSRICANQLITPSDLQLIVFIASTLALAQAVTASGTDRWLAEKALHTLPQTSMTTSSVIAVAAAISLVSHLVIGSRTARVAVILPSIVLPLASMGHDPKLLILVTVLGTGFCQTHTASAKPLAIFASAGPVTYTPSDLLWLGAALLPVMFGLLLVFGFVLAP